jgi:hypothetical protein
LQLDSARTVNWESYLDYQEESREYWSDIKTAGDTVFMKAYYYNHSGPSSSRIRKWNPDGLMNEIIFQGSPLGYDVCNGRIYYGGTYNPDENAPGNSLYKYGCCSYNGAIFQQDSIVSNDVAVLSDVKYLPNGQLYVGACESYTNSFAAKVTLNVVSSIRENPSNDYFTLFPNPTGNNVQFSFLNSGVPEFQIQLTNQLGQEVMNKEYSAEGQKNLDVSNLPRGVYFLRVSTEQSSLVKKIVLE